MVCAANLISQGPEIQQWILAGSCSETTPLFTQVHACVGIQSGHVHMM